MVENEERLGNYLSQTLQTIVIFIIQFKELVLKFHQECFTCLCFYIF